MSVCAVVNTRVMAGGEYSVRRGNLGVSRKILSINLVILNGRISMVPLNREIPV